MDKYLYTSDYDREEEIEEKTLKLIDTHCHPHDDDRKLTKIPKLKTHRICIMAVSETDWPLVIRVIPYHFLLTISQLASDYPDKVIGALGVHPWYSHTWNDFTLNKLKSLLIANPNCIVGEIGLDKTFKVHFS